MNHSTNKMIEWAAPPLATRAKNSQPQSGGASSGVFHESVEEGAGWRNGGCECRGDESCSDRIRASGGSNEALGCALLLVFFG